MKRIPIIEIFGPTIQGEGIHIGRRSEFIRVAGCDTKCSWCDTKYAWDINKAAHMSEDDIIKTLKISAPIVTLTGGNPLLYDLRNLVGLLSLSFYEVHVETQGTLWEDWLMDVHFVSVSPKRLHLRVAVLDKIVRLKSDHCQLKVVVFDKADVLFAKALHKRYPHIPLILQVGYPQCDATWLANTVACETEFGRTVRVLPQIHRLFWGGEKCR